MYLCICSSMRVDLWDCVCGSASRDVSVGEGMWVCLCMSVSVSRYLWVCESRSVCL